MEGFKYLHTYMLATVISNLTAEFCYRHIDRKSRTLDQMVQAARSGKQNIAEGSSGQSLETYIKLLGVAEGSFKELAAGFEDYLRQHHYQTWAKDDRRLANVRKFRAEWLAPNVPNTPSLPAHPEAAANALINLCAAETYMLGRQIATLNDKFVKNGGFRENLKADRNRYKGGGHAKWQQGAHGGDWGNRGGRARESYPRGSG